MTQHVAQILNTRNQKFQPTANSQILPVYSMSTKQIKSFNIGKNISKTTSQIEFSYHFESEHTQILK